MSERAAGQCAGQRCHGMRSVGVGQRAEVGAAGPRAGQRCHSMRSVGAGQHSEWGAAVRRAAAPGMGHAQDSGATAAAASVVVSIPMGRGRAQCRSGANGWRVASLRHTRLCQALAARCAGWLSSARVSASRARVIQRATAREGTAFLRVVPAACGFQYLVSAFQGVIHGFLLQHVQENFSIGEC